MNEQKGIIKYNVKMLQAIISTQVPKLSLIIGKSFGTGKTFFYISDIIRAL